MVRASDIYATSDFSLEHRREDLRDRRSSRYRDNARTFATAFATIVGALGSVVTLTHLLGLL